MLQYKRNTLSVALAAAMVLAAGVAQAQSTDAASQQDQADSGAPEQTETAPTGKATNLDKVTVTGIRAAIETSIDTKKESTSIVESVSAEDIGKLPDISIAESIARLPGLAAQRVAGRAQVISVRGLSPDFSTTLLNGRELVSTGDNRSVEFDQYPSELMSGVTVYKTPDAALVGQGLSGTLDMRTVRPLDFDKPVFAVSVRGQRNSLGSAANADGDGNRINASYIDQYFGGALGLSIGFSHSEIPIQENQVGLYEPWKNKNDDGTPLDRPGVPAFTYYSDGIKALRRTGYIRRNAAMASMQFRPINEWTSTVDIFHTSAVQEDTANQFEVNLGNYPSGLSITDAMVNGNGTFTGGVASGIYPLVRGMYNKREDSIDAAGWNNEIKIGQANVTADLSWSKSHRDEVNLENNTQLLPNPQLDTLILNYRRKDFSTLTPGRDYSNPGTLFLANTIYGSGYGKTPNIVDELVGFKVNVNLPAPGAVDGFFSDFDIGAHYGGREKTKHQPEGSINLGAQGETTIAPDLQYGLVDLGFAGVGSIPSWNVPGAVGRYMTFAPNEEASYLVAKAWTVYEDISTGWLRANIDTQWGSIPVRGNIGVQVQHTDQSSSSNYWDASQPAGQNVRPYENGKIYTDWLPSLNLAFTLPHDQTLRFAAARQIARARLDQLRASFEFGISTSTGIPGGSGGNPQLNPWIANAFDISYEKYFGNTKGYVAAAAFYKDLRSYIFTQSRTFDFSPFIAQMPPEQQALVTTNFGQFSAPYNGEGGKLKGLELTASLPLDLFWAPMEGFGFIASASFFDSNIKIRDPESATSVGNDDISLPGLSDEVYNLTAYYENHGFGARLSQRMRSDFIGEIGNFAGNRTLRYVEGENQLDAQLSYAFEEGSLNGLTLLFQASNLTNSSYRTYAGTKDRPLENIEWGRTFLLGVGYKF
jgi:iron complex outermembrane receptor protein